MRVSRWNGKIDHVSCLNNISETTVESRGSRGLCLLDLFFSIAYPGLAGTERAVLLRLHKTGGKVGNEKRGVSWERRGRRKLRQTH